MRYTKELFWRLANTGLRSPQRMVEGLKVYARSSLVGHIHGKPNEIALERVLEKAGLITRMSTVGKSDGTSGRKWRKAWNNYGCVVIQAEGRYRDDPKDNQNGIGHVDDITPMGRLFLNASTFEAQQQCFLRALSAYMYKVPNSVYYFSPLRWTLQILLRLEERTGNSAVSFVEFAACIQTSFPYLNDADSIVSELLTVRARKADSSAKKLFDGKLYDDICKEAGYTLEKKNFHEYGDMNLRNLRMTGMFVRNGRGIAINPVMHTMAEMLSQNVCTNESLHDRLVYLYNVPALPTDSERGAVASLLDAERALRDEDIPYEPVDMNSLSSVQDIDNAASYLRSVRAGVRERRFAERQRYEWQEISGYMELLAHNGGTMTVGENEISVDSSECPQMLEWTIWRSLLAIDSLTNAPSEVRSFNIDDDCFPTNTAPGGRPDLVAEYQGAVIVGEVTMARGSRQEAMEGEPVRRHVVDVQERNREKDVYGMFIASGVDLNTTETFRHGIWYLKNAEMVRLHIVPFTIRQYQMLFCHMFQKGMDSPGYLISILRECCSYAPSLTAPEWKERIWQEIDMVCNQ